MFSCWCLPTTDAGSIAKKKDFRGKHQMCDIALWKRWGLLVAAAFWRTFQRWTKRNSSSAVAQIPAEVQRVLWQWNVGSLQRKTVVKGAPGCLHTSRGQNTAHSGMATFFKAANGHKTLYHARRHDWSHVSIKIDMCYKQRRWREVMCWALLQIY